MQLEIGTRVRSIDDQEVGRIAWLILDPDSGRVKMTVIQKGLLLAHEIEIPLDAFAPDPNGGVRLSYTAEEVTQLPRFDQSRYTSPAPDRVASWGWPEPAAGLLVPDYTLPGPTLTDEDRGGRSEEDLDNAIIREGNEVFSSDGEKVGDIHRITFDADTGRTLAFAVRSGFLFTHEVELPGETIASVDDEAVYLNLTKDQVRQREPD